MHAIENDSGITSLIIPWPPSANSLWRHHGKTVYCQKKYKDYKHTVLRLLLNWKRKPIKDRIAIDIKAYPPDKRIRDIDNPIKATLDSLMYANIFLDDSQIDKLSIQRMDIRKGGELHISIEPIKEAL